MAEYQQSRPDGMGMTVGNGKEGTQGRKYARRVQEQQQAKSGRSYNKNPRGNTRMQDGAHTAVRTRNTHPRSRTGAVRRNDSYSHRGSGLRDPRLLMSLILLIAVIVTVGIALAVRRSSHASRASQAASSSDTTQIQDIALEQNAYPAVNDLFRRYYEAMQNGDTDAIAAMSAELSDEERIRINEISKYIDTYPSIDVYTQPGPVENSYVCYVVTTMKFKDHDWEVPGMQTMYVCTNEQGELFINNAHNQDKTVTDYIQKASLQDEVVDLNNKVTADYNQLVADNADLSAYLNELSSNIDVSVGQALAQLPKNEDSADGSTDTNVSGTGASDSDDASDGTQTMVTANDTVNVRNAASENADIIGMTTIGDQYVLIQDDDGSGWLEISFMGSTGYVKAEYFSK